WFSILCKIHRSLYIYYLYVVSRYYELGPDDPPYAAKFYDCCGAEDPNAVGCRTDYHVSYDEN
ncbi:hypothetical protein HPP92_014184, partial [Vanilla planifolia]